MSPTSLYLCYQSVLEPLTQTQVIAYLEGLAKSRYGIVLLTFEPRPLPDGEECHWRNLLARKGITWYWLRYHKRPTLPATFWDVLMGTITGLWIIRRHSVRLIHARAYVAGLMGLLLSRLTGAKFLFDIRGLMAEEYVDAGAWQADGWLFKLTKWVERFLVRAADGIVVLTRRAKDLLQRWYPGELAGKPLEVIPCCVDLRKLPHRLACDIQPEGTSEGMTMVYAGKLGGWYPTREMVDFFASARQVIRDLRWRVFTQGDPAELRRYVAVRELASEVAVGVVPPNALPSELLKARIGLCLYKRNLSNPACSPTKIAEYLAAGLPVVASAGVGDTDAVLSRSRAGDQGEQSYSPVGVLVPSLTEDAYHRAALELQKLLDDPDTPRRCRAVAEEQFDLERVGWARYTSVYQALAGYQPTPPVPVDLPRPGGAHYTTA